MLALWRDWACAPPRHNPKIASSLGLFAGRPAAFHAEGDTACAYLAAPRPSKRVSRWRPCRQDDGSTILFHGRMDNAAEVAAELGLPDDDSARIYGAAVRRWGDRADLRIIGRYSAVVAGKDVIRLSRSPWDAPPLHYAQFEGQAVAASVPRVLLAAGLPAELDRTRLADSLYLNLMDRQRGWYAGSGRVAYGTIVNLRRDGTNEIIEFYDPRQLPKVRFSRDADYVEAANELLARATAANLATARRPGVMLSGGLDSPILADEILRQLPPEARLPSFTFAPCDAWQDSLPADLMGDERPLVREFARMHPRLDPHFTQNPDAAFDSRWNELFAAIGGAPNHLCNFYVYHGIWQQARDHGCDLLLTAEFGNETYSNEGRWAFVEYLLTLQWRQLWLALRERPGDPRSTMHRLASMSLLRLLPFRKALRRLRHPRRAILNQLATMLPAAERAAAHRRASDAGAVIALEYPASRRHAVAFDYYWNDGEGAEVQQGFEQVYGLRQADVPAWRPLAEFCAGLPTDQFIRDGETRRLARRMAIGRLPEAQRTNRRHGLHNVDWHERLTPRIEEFRSEIERIATIPELSGLVDPQRMLDALDSWPEAGSFAPEDWVPQAIALPRGLLTARFVDYVSGRND